MIALTACGTRPSPGVALGSTPAEFRFFVVFRIHRQGRFGSGRKRHS
ncbi:hypothetical protein [Macromonas nakdongensis]|nr:hypothetical protein [Macromonas nakdongensis]